MIIGAPGENSGNGAVYALTAAASGSLTSTGGLYASTFGISTAGTPHLGINFAD